ncbi:hypothetical protein Godav_017091 [Gossypium davidsonii]|uniref:Cytochrome P450 n=3 Tax=Gossypium TaxID=3633 RepID=A0A7J8QS75_GOSDV|nr:hypothetical protein [Gossypium davidsonii]
MVDWGFSYLVHNLICKKLEIPPLMELINENKLYNPLFLSFILFIFSFLLWLKLSKHKLQNLPPSPPKLPIIGHLHKLVKLPHRSLRDLSLKYGSLMFLNLGQNPTLVVSSADSLKEMVKNYDVVFMNKPNTTAANILFYGCKDLGFSPYGDYWRQVRKLCVLELLSARRVQSFQFVREEEVDAIIRKIREAAVNGDVVDLTKMLMAVSSNIVSRSVISRKAEDDNGGIHFGELTRRVMVLFTTLCFGDFWPSLKWLDYVTGFISRLKSTFWELDLFFDQVIDEHKEKEAIDETKDFLSIILQLQKDGLDLTQDNIKAILLDMFAGGTETTSTTAEWAMSELLKKPDVLKKVEQDVRKVAKNKQKIELNDLNQMKYLKCVIKETLRLHPPVVFLVRRGTSEAVKLGNYDIPPDTTVFINVWAIQRDPIWWENPEEFIPERFENSRVDFKGQDFQFIPFGCGRRDCPGMPFAIASLEYLVANLLFRFDWKLGDGETAETLDLIENYGLTVNKKVPLRVMPTIFHPST